MDAEQLPGRPPWSAPCRVALLVVALLAVAGCVGGGGGAGGGGSVALGPDPASAVAEESELLGSEILNRVCTKCHDLGGLSAYADYWGEPEWREMIDTMITYGAVLTPEEYEVLARYLGEHYGP